MRIITIAAGVILVITSVWCFAHPGVSFLALAFILGIAMLIHGISIILGYFAYRDRHGGWVLAEGIISTVLGCIVLSNQLATDAMIPLFFGMWVIFSGAVRLSAGLEARRKSERAWGLILGLGAAGLAVGVYCFFNPVAAAVALGILIGMTFLLQGINMLTFGILMPGKKDR